MPNLPPGSFALYPFAEPPVPAGSYVLGGNVTGMPGDVQPLGAQVQVTAPRYALPPDQILSTFPPAGAQGAFGSRLPQIVLRRRTLPWERSPDLDGNPAGEVSAKDTEYATVRLAEILAAREARKAAAVATKGAAHVAAAAAAPPAVPVLRLKKKPVLQLAAFRQP